MKLSPVVSRAMALAILAALVWAAHAFAVVPLSARFRLYEESIARSEELVQRYRRIGASRPVLESQLAEARRRLSPEGLYLAAASDALVAADLQNRVKAIVEQRDGKLSSTEIVPARDEGQVRRIGIRVKMTATTEDLQEIFHGLEAAKPYLFIDDVVLRIRSARRGKNKTSQAESTLTVGFELFGYTRAGES